MPNNTPIEMLSKQISDLIERFAESQKLYVNSINVSWIDVTQIGYSKEYELRYVEINIDPHVSD